MLTLCSLLPHSALSLSSLTFHATFSFPGSGGAEDHTGRLAQPNGGSGYGGSFGYSASAGSFSGGQLHPGPYGSLGLGVNANLSSAINSGVHPVRN